MIIRMNQAISGGQVWMTSAEGMFEIDTVGFANRLSLINPLHVLHPILAECPLPPLF